MILWIHQSRPRPQWYDLPPDEQRDLLDTWDRIRSDTATEAHTESIGEYSIRGQSTHERVEVWRFGDLAELDRHWSRLTAANYLDWRTSDNLVGTEPIPFAGEAVSI